MARIPSVIMLFGALHAVSGTADLMRKEVHQVLEIDYKADVAALHARATAKPTPRVHGAHDGDGDGDDEELLDARSSWYTPRGRAVQNRNHQLDTTNRIKTGKLKQTQHGKCMLAVTAFSGSEEVTQLKEYACPVSASDAVNKDMQWTRDSKDKQIKLVDRQICLHARPDTKAVFAHDCVNSVDPDYHLQQWDYSHSRKQIQWVGTDGSGNKLCLATSSTDSYIFLEVCTVTLGQQWQIAA